MSPVPPSGPALSPPVLSPPVLSPPVLSPPVLSRRTFVLACTAGLVGCAPGGVGIPPFAPPGLEASTPAAADPSAAAGPQGAPAEPPTGAGTVEGTELDPPVDWGSAVDGDDLDAVFAALERYDGAQRDVVVRPGMYRRSTALRPPDGVRLVTLGSTFVGTAPGVNGVLLELTGSADVTVVGGLWDANRDAYRGDRTEWRHGIQVNDAQRIVLRDLEVTRALGDGIYVGLDTRRSRDVTLHRVVCRDNSRNGLSVTSCDGLLCEDSRFDDNGYQDLEPRAGIDVESHGPTWSFDNIVFRRCVAGGNGGRGFLHVDVAPNSRSGSVLVEDCTFARNGRAHRQATYGAFYVRQPQAITVNRCVGSDGYVGLLVEGGGGGRAEFHDCRFVNNRREGLYMMGGNSEVALHGVTFSGNISEASYSGAATFVGAGTLLADDSAFLAETNQVVMRVTTDARSVDLNRCELSGRDDGAIDHPAGVPVNLRS